MKQIKPTHHIYRITPHGREQFTVRLRNLEEQWLDALEEARASYTSSHDLKSSFESLNAIDTEMARINLLLLKCVDLVPERIDCVCLGTCVTLETENNSRIYTIVSSIEADPSSGYISEASPLGQALNGKRLNDTIMVREQGKLQPYRLSRIT